jgi:transcriptional regulator with XRE-family HTH domain/tetratricopeptide (TPR) repeat protein
VRGLGALLYAYRRRAWLTQEQLAERAGLSVRTVSNLEAARVRRPHRESLRRLADALGLTDEERGRLRLGGGDQAGTLDRPELRPCLLPPDTVDFTGRARQIELLEGVLAGADRSTAVAVSALVGEGGIGKTALAVHVSHRLRHAFPDGQLYVDLHGAEAQPAEPGEVLARWLTALGLDSRALPDGQERRSELFRALLADRRVLVVLDNAASERQVRPLLPGSPTCAVLLTSRPRLSGLSAHTVRLGVLDPAEALALLARVAGPERVVAEPAVAEALVGLCGHLPLAVRIAGARLAARPHWPVGRMTQRLANEQRRLDELSLADLAVRTSVGTSYGTLAPAIRRAFRLLGLLDTPDFSAWMLAALLESSLEDAEDQLDALTDAQLLACTGKDDCGQLRYRFHDLVRLYARERAEGEDDARQRAQGLARTFGALLASADLADRGVAERVASDIRGSAPRWPLDPATVRTVQADGLAWFESERATLTACVTQASSAGFDELAWELAARGLSFFAFRGLYDDWLHTHEQALQACTGAGNRRGQAVLLRNLGCLRMTGVRGSPGVVVSRAGQALDTFRELGERRGEVDMLVLRAFGLRHQGDFHQARARVDAAMSAAEALAYPLGQCRILYLRAVLSREQGHDQVAVEWAQRCLDLAGRISTLHDQVLALWELAAACRDPGAVDRVSTLLQEGVQTCRRRGERLLEGYLLLSLGGLRLRFRLPGVRPTLEDGLSIFAEHSVLLGHCVGLRLLGELERLEGRPARAIAQLTQAVQLSRRLRSSLEQALSLMALGDACQADGAVGAARCAWEEARQLFLRLRNEPAAAAATSLLGRLDPVHRTAADGAAGALDPGQGW